MSKDRKPLSDDDLAEVERRATEFASLCARHDLPALAIFVDVVGKRCRQVGSAPPERQETTLLVLFNAVLEDEEFSDGLNGAALRTVAAVLRRWAQAAATGPAGKEAPPPAVEVATLGKAEAELQHRANLLLEWCLQHHTAAFMMFLPILKMGQGTFTLRSSPPQVSDVLLLLGLHALFAAGDERVVDDRPDLAGPPDKTGVAADATDTLVKVRALVDAWTARMGVQRTPREGGAAFRVVDIDPKPTTGPADPSSN